MTSTPDKHAALAELLMAGLGGDTQSYHAFLQGITPIIRAVVSRKLTTGDTEDVVQEILISVHKSSHTYDASRPIMPWLMAIVKFRITDQLRKIYSKAEHVTVNIDDVSEILPQNVTFEPANNEVIEELLQDASEREKAILTLMHVEGYTAKETGQKLGMKESAVKVAAHRAVKKLRNKSKSL